MVKIRSYKDSDYKDIQFNLKEANMLHPYDTRVNLKNKILKNPGSILVAEVDGKAVGQQFIVEDRWQSFLYRLSVRKSHRKQGIASKLIKAAEKHLKKKGVKEVGFYVRTKRLPVLKKYYEKLGYACNKNKCLHMHKKL